MKKLNHPVETAVAPMKADAMARAVDEAKNLINRYMQALEYAGDNVDLIAPYPKAMRESRMTYVAKTRKRDLINMFCDFHSMRPSPREYYEARERGVKLQDWTRATLNPERAARFIEQCRVTAGLQYDAFVTKLVGKVGAVVSASIEGNHVWGHSYLTVITEVGKTEVWKTQQIVNVSVLGLLFNQWPTRKLKNKEAR